MYAFDLKDGRVRCLRGAISISVSLTTYWIVMDEEVWYNGLFVGCAIMDCLIEAVLTVLAYVRLLHPTMEQIFCLWLYLHSCSSCNVAGCVMYTIVCNCMACTWGSIMS
jgi:hypothetical protein